MIGGEAGPCPRTRRRPANAMDAEELSEVSREAHRREERVIGMTMAVFAALLAAATMLGHRAHTEEVVLQTRTTDEWAFYQAKNGRGQMYEADAELAALSANGASLAGSFRERAAKEKRDAEEIRRGAERREEETRAQARRAALFDGAEIFLEVAIVLCSVALLAGALVFWRASFVSGAIGLAIGLYALFAAFTS